MEFSVTSQATYLLSLIQNTPKQWTTLQHSALQLYTWYAALSIQTTTCPVIWDIMDLDLHQKMYNFFYFKQFLWSFSGEFPCCFSGEFPCYSDARFIDEFPIEIQSQRNFRFCSHPNALRVIVAELNFAHTQNLIAILLPGIKLQQNDIFTECIFQAAFVGGMPSALITAPKVIAVSSVQGHPCIRINWSLVSLTISMVYCSYLVIPPSCRRPGDLLGWGGVIKEFIW